MNEDAIHNEDGHPPSPPHAICDPDAGQAIQKISGGYKKRYSPRLDDIDLPHEIRVALFLSNSDYDPDHLLADHYISRTARFVTNGLLRDAERCGDQLDDDALRSIPSREEAIPDDDCKAEGELGEFFAKLHRIQFPDRHTAEIQLLQIDIITRRLREASPRDQQIVLLRAENISYREIATQLEISIATAQKRFSRFVKECRDERKGMKNGG